MELRDYVAIVGKYKWLFWAVVLVSTIAVFMYTNSQPKRFEGSVTLYVSQSLPVNTPNEQNQYGNYYAIQGAGLYAGELKAFITDPAVVSNVFARAGYGLPDVRLARLGQVFVAKPVEPAGIQISYDDSSNERVTKLLTAAADELTAQTKAIQSANAAQALVVTHTDPYVQAYQVSAAIAAVVAAIVSAALMIALILLIDLSRPKK